MCVCVCVCARIVTYLYGTVCLKLRKFVHALAPGAAALRFYLNL
jgi:hypothetical protein